MDIDGESQTVTEKETLFRMADDEQMQLVKPYEAKATEFNIVDKITCELFHDIIPSPTNDVISKTLRESWTSESELPATPSSENDEEQLPLSESNSVLENETCDHGTEASSECSAEDSPEVQSAHVDSKRTRRNSKRRLDSSTLCCPVCSVSVRLPELDSHYRQEVDKLAKVNKNVRKPAREDSGVNMTFVQVRCNRENRLTAKVSKYAAKAKKEVQCPVCNLKMSGCEEDINKHVALCVQNEEISDEPIINVMDDEDDDDGSFEEYEFGDETRIRAISLVPGGYRSLQGQVAKRNRKDEDEDLDVVDVDDTMAFGQPQYTELDVITNRNGDDDSQEQLRKAVLIDPSVQPLVLESRKWNNAMECVEEQKENSRDSAADQIVCSLKEKIKELEDQNKCVKCLICMEAYTKPVVSTTCWHVYCEECWLMTMGVKKLCPQCNMIVFPSDLRRIYL